MASLENAGIFVDFVLLLTGIGIASDHIQSGYTKYTPTVVLSMFIACFILTGILLSSANIDNVFILFTFATFTLASILWIFASILASNRYYA